MRAVWPILSAFPAAGAANANNPDRIHKMLQSIRDRSQGLIVGVIVFLISLTFALWGIQSYVDAGGQVVVAEADGDEILLSEFQDSLQRFRRQAQSILGDSFDANAWDSPEIRQRALDELINERVLIGVIDDARIRIGDVQVARQLQEIPSFQDENGFSRAIYEQRVPLLGLSQAGFELKLREDMARAQRAEEPYPLIAYCTPCGIPCC